MQRTRINREIYPDFDATQRQELEKCLGKHGIKIYYLFDKGLEFEYDDSGLGIKEDYVGMLLCFVDKRSGSPIVGISENFGTLDFTFYLQSKELGIPILEL